LTTEGVHCFLEEFTFYPSFSIVSYHNFKICYLIVQSIYKFCSWKAMDISFQGQKTKHFYLVQFKFYCKGNTKKLLKIKKGRALFKKSTCFCRYLRNQLWYSKTDSDWAGQGLYSEKKYKKINAKTRIHL
jgi:hypothetical protein